MLLLLVGLHVALILLVLTRRYPQMARFAPLTSHLTTYCKDLLLANF